MALRDGLMLVEAMGCSNLVINSNRVEVIDVMKNGGHAQGLSTKIACFFVEIEFNDVIFEHCSGESNFAAHVLAREAVDNPQIWKDDPPEFIVDVIANGVSVFPKLI